MTRIVFDTVTYRPGVADLFAGLSFEVSGPGLVALVGPNGAGKSSLLRLAAGLAAPAAGHVLLDGRDLAALNEAERARAIAYLPPDGRAAWPITARRLVALGRIPHLKPLRRLTADDEAAIEHALQRTATAHLAERGFDTLSSGEQARVLLARTLAVGASVILLDEPTAALDVRHQLGVLEILAAEARRGALVIVSLHALDLAARHADRVIVLDQGQPVADGPPAQALTTTVLADVFGVEAPDGLTSGGLRLSR
ncbi:ABC transporter ATP-binding protein [Maricaulis maris]|uniref:Iron complex transport system ATP-binding protein n=1 Tax=Maricaulis maris TaxID=74318 RepID=A0A495DNV3_9PROT|nr:ABC transporter ATP-binding protein [Maricaulis maris]RKR03709.1 iron complex transport system ATP-binding protein [Maricaulis maris]